MILSPTSLNGHHHKISNITLSPTSLSPFDHPNEFKSPSTFVGPSLNPSDLNTVVGETLAVFRLPKIRKNCQCLDGQVGKNFLEIFGGNYNFFKVSRSYECLIFHQFLNIHEFLDFFEVFV